MRSLACPRRAMLIFIISCISSILIQYPFRYPSSVYPGRLSYLHPTRRTAPVGFESTAVWPVGSRGFNISFFSILFSILFLSFFLVVSVSFDSFIMCWGIFGGGIFMFGVLLCLILGVVHVLLFHFYSCEGARASSLPLPATRRTVEKLGRTRGKHRLLANLIRQIEGGSPLCKSNLFQFISS
ncbi:hypothetical protein QBC44DRAFT_67266 [Cladorrhinum sp. PSN332]|nr:hypothetical protein QBC44DRAFT_67266 [Cladorrhinum sp. PSN332]